MKKLILYIVIGLIFLINPSVNLVNAQISSVSCMGFYSPALTISVYDSLTNEIVNSATVDITYLGSSKKQERALFDASRQAYFSDLNGWGDEPLGIVVSAPGFHTSVLKDLNYVQDISCGAKNEWKTAIYMCPVGQSCL